MADEPDLLADFGIYGNRAVGRQEIDERARTLQFVLEFDNHAHRATQNLWERLELYAKNYGEILDKGP